MKNFKTLFVAGERCDGPTLEWAQKALNVPVVDHWWQTETGLLQVNKNRYTIVRGVMSFLGWPITSNFLGIGDSIFPTKKGSVCKPTPGFRVKVS
ncbi:hypothetical protein M1146_06065 [Patescibacteria group bacterium]|nr:hypothetical protein [Patescibacteria group bacterium]